VAIIGLLELGLLLIPLSRKLQGDGEALKSREKSKLTVAVTMNLTKKNLQLVHSSQLPGKPFTMRTTQSSKGPARAVATT
jgi:hypothetical protein